MIITRSGLTVRCARCEREVRHFAAAYDPVKSVWVGTAFCHGDSAALRVPDRLSETTVFRPRGTYAHAVRSVAERKCATDRQTKSAREQPGASA